MELLPEGEKTEDRRRKTEDGRRKTEDGRQKTEDRRRKTEERDDLRFNPTNEKRFEEK